jgi:phosphatidylethanolamine/phosphatidyl-N-methylethanolamine N-methyltransferase
MLLRLNATAHFILEAVSQPRQVGAIAPSSRHLTSAMARWLPADPHSYVVELGPGTGAVTEALIAHGLAEHRLVALEKSPKMAAYLRRRFPRAVIIAGDALEMDVLLKRHGVPTRKIGAFFSSLPLQNFGEAFARQLMQKVHSLLGPTGMFVQYSYRLGKKQSQALADFQPVASDLVWLNLPPARVSVYQK